MNHPAPLPPTGAPESIAAIDLGSNSFHLLIAAWDAGGVRVIDHAKEMVRLAAGLDDDRRITPEARKRALDTLRRFGARIRALDPKHVRAVGTNTFRAASDAKAFLEEVRDTLGHSVEVISGEEEARLVYLGVAHSVQPVDGHQLVIDIGGGSTELIVGRGFEPIFRRSLRMGCVTFSEGFFRGGKLTRDRFDAAVFAAANEFAALDTQVRNLGFDVALGSSGTMRAIARICNLEGIADPVTPKALEKLRRMVLDAKRIERLSLQGLSDRRRPSFPGGLAIAMAAMERFRIKELTAVRGALREGVVRDLIGRAEGRDTRDETVHGVQTRFSVDTAQADRVARRLASLRLAVAEAWELTDAHWAQLGDWAAALHELGLALSYRGHHRSSAFMIRHLDMPGFSRADQRAVAALTLNHRRKVRMVDLRDAFGDDAKRALRLVVLLRLAVRLERPRGDVDLPDPELIANGDALTLALPAGTWAERPLLAADLVSEAEQLAAAGIRLTVTPIVAGPSTPGA